MHETTGNVEKIEFMGSEFTIDQFFELNYNCNAGPGERTPELYK
jgi:hypothetical protein